MKGATPTRKRGKGRAYVDRLAVATDRVLLKAMTHGVPLKGPGGEFLIDERGKVVTGPPSAALIKAALNRLKQISDGIVPPKSSDKPGTGELLRAMHDLERMRAMAGEPATAGDLAADDDDDSDDDDDEPAAVHLGRRHDGGE